MLFKAVLLFFLFFGFKSIAIFMLSVNLALHLFGKRFFAAFLNQFYVKYNRVADPLKVKLFKELNEMKSSDGKVKILEVGGASGANFAYYTVPAEIDIVDPNPHFIPYLDENKKSYPNLQINPFKQGFGEDLKAAGIADNSVDAVVMTLVLCSVEDQIKCLQEVQRVLKPGGKFFYMEHIIADEGDNLRFVQLALMQGGFWPCLVDGCCTDRDTPKVVNKFGGWSKLDQTKYDLPANTDNDYMFSALRYVLRPHVMGVATK